jgi:hypothetical protein
MIGKKDLLKCNKSLTEVLRSKIKDNEQEELLAVILRNAKRLGNSHKTFWMLQELKVNRYN